MSEYDGSIDNSIKSQCIYVIRCELQRNESEELLA